MRVDPTGEFPWLALAIVVVCSVIGGIVGNIVAIVKWIARNIFYEK